MSSEYRYLVPNDQMVGFCQSILSYGGKELKFPEGWQQSVYCSTAQLKTPTTVHVRLRRYLKEAHTSFGEESPVILEAKLKENSNKFRVQLPYGEVVQLLAQPRELIASIKTNTRNVLVASWPASQKNFEMLVCALEEIDYFPLYPVAGSIAERFHYQWGSGPRITLDTNLGYFGFYNRDYFRAIPIGREVCTGKVEFKPMGRSFESLPQFICLRQKLENIGAQALAVDYQETKLRKLYTQNLRQRQYGQ